MLCAWVARFGGPRVVGYRHQYSIGAERLSRALTPEETVAYDNATKNARPPISKREHLQHLTRQAAG